MTRAGCKLCAHPGIPTRNTKTSPSPHLVNEPVPIGVARADPDVALQRQVELEEPLTGERRPAPSSHMQASGEDLGQFLEAALVSRSTLRRGNAVLHASVTLCRSAPAGSAAHRSSAARWTCTPATTCPARCLSSACSYVRLQRADDASTSEKEMVRLPSSLEAASSCSKQLEASHTCMQCPWSMVVPESRTAVLTAA